MEQKLSNGFFDLCVNYSNNDVKQLSSVITRAFEMGYRTVAINQMLDEVALESEKKKKRKGEEREIPQQTIPEPIDISTLKECFEGKLQIYNRLTFAFSDPTKTHTLNHSQVFKKYDIYAVIPKNQAAMQFVCSQLNADLITINSTCVGLKINRKLYLQAIERGLHFEIQYADILNSDKRKLAIHYSHLFHTYGKSKNIIVSSGATNAIDIRNPYDVINLGNIFGLSEVQSKASISWQCKLLLLKSERRRFGKGIFSISVTKNESDNESNKCPSKNVT